MYLWGCMYPNKRSQFNLGTPALKSGEILAIDKCSTSWGQLEGVISLVTVPTNPPSRIIKQVTALDHPKLAVLDTKT